MGNFPDRFFLKSSILGKSKWSSATWFYYIPIALKLAYKETNFKLYSIDPGIKSVLFF